MSHTLNLLGSTLAELVPLMEEAMRALDKPGTRALRRKIDGSFHFAVSIYGVLRREDAPDSDWDRMVLPHYERATAVWPGRLAYESRKAKAVQAAEPIATTRGLQLIVDNTKAARVPLALTQIEGGAA